jgi:hypothetical protein
MAVHNELFACQSLIRTLFLDFVFPERNRCTQPDWCIQGTRTFSTWFRSGVHQAVEQCCFAQWHGAYPKTLPYYLG